MLISERFRGVVSRIFSLAKPAASPMGVLREPSMVPPVSLAANLSSIATEKFPAAQKLFPP